MNQSEPIFMPMNALSRDPEHQGCNKAHFSKQTKVLDKEPPTNLICQVKISNDFSTTAQIFWTIFGLYDPSGRLNMGHWRLPLYDGPTKSQIPIIAVP